MTFLNDDSGTYAKYKLAAMLEDEGRISEALEVLLSIEELVDPIVRTRIGVLLYELERWEEAEIHFLLAARQDPVLWQARFYLGMIYRAEDRLEEAAEQLQIASQLDESAGTLNVLGVVQLDLGLRGLAEESLRRAVKLDPNDEEAILNLARAISTSSSSEALTLFERAVEIDPNYALAHREFGWFLRNQQELAEASYHLRRAVELAPDDFWSRIYLANLLWQLNDLSTAEDSFTQAVRVWPERSVGYWSLAHFYERQGKSQEAETLYYKAIEVDPTDAQAKWRLGNYLKNIGDARGARKYLQESIELNPTDNRVHEALANLDEKPVAEPHR